MAAQPFTEEELRRICLEASARGESVGHILSDYLHLNFLREHEAADGAAGHRSEEDPQDWWTESGASRPGGRHRAVS